ncbi:MAG: DegT/DnrJ/EryC1/StrS family aminotransferase [Arachnia sp.]
MDVPFLDLRAQWADIADEAEPALLEAFRSCGFIGGPHVAGFERDYAAFAEARHCIGVGNGTDALELAMRAAGVGPGGEVIMPANTFIATAEAASRIGARPVPVDVEDACLLIDPERIEAAITERTQAIVPVHLYGQCAPVEQVIRVAEGHHLPVIEDAAQSQGATRHGRSAGSLALAAATSFYPGKNLGASGDAGAVTTSDDGFAHQVRLVSAHGSIEKYSHEVVGLNSRLDAIHAITLAAKLRRLPAWNRARRAVAELYAELLGGIDGLRLPETLPGNEHVWHLFVVRVDQRNRVLDRLHSAGIGAGLHYPQPWYLSPAYRHLGYRPGTAPVAERAADRLLSLPMFPHLKPQQQERVADAVRRAVR